MRVQKCARPTMAEIMLLVRLPNTVTNLAEIQGVTRQRITQLGDSLESKGWITRTQRGRFVHLEISPTGQQAMSEFRTMVTF